MSTHTAAAKQRRYSGDRRELRSDMWCGANNMIEWTLNKIILLTHQQSHAALWSHEGQLFERAPSDRQKEQSGIAPYHKWKDNARNIFEKSKQRWCSVNMRLITRAKRS